MAPPEMKKRDLDANRQMDLAQQGLQGDKGELPHKGAMEAGFGRSLDGVEAAMGTREAESACNALGAKAYCYGNQIAFKDKNPSRELVAHEAAHVMQQQEGGQHHGVGRGSGAAEAQADMMAGQVNAGQLADLSSLGGGPVPALQLKEDDGAGGGAQRMAAQQLPDSVDAAFAEILDPAVDEYAQTSSSSDLQVGALRSQLDFFYSEYQQTTSLLGNLRTLASEDSPHLSLVPAWKSTLESAELNVGTLLGAVANRTGTGRPAPELAEAIERLTSEAGIQAGELQSIRPALEAATRDVTEELAGSTNEDAKTMDEELRSHGVNSPELLDPVNDLEQVTSPKEREKNLGKDAGAPEIEAYRQKMAGKYEAAQPGLDAVNALGRAKSLVQELDSTYQEIFEFAYHADLPNSSAIPLELPFLQCYRWMNGFADLAKGLDQAIDDAVQTANKTGQLGGLAQKVASTQQQYEDLESQEPQKMKLIQYAHQFVRRGARLKNLIHMSKAGYKRDLEAGNMQGACVSKILLELTEKKLDREYDKQQYFVQKGVARGFTGQLQSDSIVLLDQYDEARQRALKTWYRDDEVLNEVASELAKQGKGDKDKLIEAAKHHGKLSTLETRVLRARDSVESSKGSMSPKQYRDAKEELAALHDMIVSNFNKHFGNGFVSELKKQSSDLDDFLKQAQKDADAIADDGVKHTDEGGGLAARYGRRALSKTNLGYFAGKTKLALDSLANTITLMNSGDTLSLDAKTHPLLDGLAAAISLGKDFSSLIPGAGKTQIGPFLGFYASMVKDMSAFFVTLTNAARDKQLDLLSVAPGGWQVGTTLTK